MNLLNEIRRSKKIKYKDLASITGYSKGYLGNIFSGRLAVIPKSAQFKIAKALKVQRNTIFGNDEIFKINEIFIKAENACRPIKIMIRKAEKSLAVTKNMKLKVKEFISE